MARDAIGAFREMTGRARRFARRVLRTCRGNIDDVHRGPLFTQMLEQHGVEEEDFESTDDETDMAPTQHAWMNELLGGDYASQVPYAPVYDPEYVPLSQHGTWEHGQSSQQGPSEQAESSRAAEERAQAVQQPPPRRTTRYGRTVSQPDAYTPGTRGRGRGGGRRRLT